MHSDKRIITADKTESSNRIGKVEVEIRLVQKFEHFFQLTTSGCSKKCVSLTTLSELLKISIKSYEFIIFSVCNYIYIHYMCLKNDIFTRLSVLCIV